MQVIPRRRSNDTVQSSFYLYHNYDEALEQTAHWISPALGEKGLDIGTGTGNLAGKLLQHGADMTASTNPGRCYADVVPNILRCM